MCGKLIYRKKSGYENRQHHYCSKECYMKSINETKRETRTCKLCGKEFTVKKSRPKILCSSKCQIDWSRTEWQRDAARTRTINNLQNGIMPQVNSSTQIITNDILDELNIKYENEYRLGRFSMDNYLNEYNLFIEVMGDYWHCSPIKYSSPTNEIQKERIESDFRKNMYIKESGNYVLYLWEKDFIKRRDICGALIKLYVNNSGQLDDYNSFNYDYDIDGKISLNKNIVKPFYLKSPA